MKKLLALLLVFLMLITAVVGCSKTGDGESSELTSSEDLSADFEDVESEEDYEEEFEEEPEEEEFEEEPEEEVEEEPEEEVEEEPEEEPEEEVEEEPEEEPEEEESSKPVSSEEEEPLTPEELRLEQLLLGKDEEFNKDAIYHEGNLARLAKAIKKSKNGEKAVLVFYGNAANTSCNSDGTEAGEPYSGLVKDWWSKNIGPCEVVLSGADNLTSINACMRVEYDVLKHKPDLVFLDFSVQDGISSQAKTNARGYDNLVRRILASETSPAVVSLLLTGAEQQTYTMNANNANMFASAAEQQKEVSKWYDIPVIDFENTVWENFTELVKVTTKKEIPLITWASIGLSNIVMNNDGHVILSGAITSFIDGVLKKLDSITTTIPAIPTETCFGVSKYMKGSFITVGDVIDGTAKDKGYAFNLTAAEMKEYEYNYERVSDNSHNSMYPAIKTYRHYIPETTDEEDVKLATAQKYLELTIPEVTNSETYFLLNTTATVSTKSISNKNILKYAPISLVYYDANGKVISTAKAPSSNFVETAGNGKTSAVKVPVGTTKIEFKIYTNSGTVRLLGLGQFE